MINWIRALSYLALPLLLIYGQFKLFTIAIHYDFWSLPTFYFLSFSVMSVAIARTMRIKSAKFFREQREGKHGGI